jgi:hypothetical protein
MHFPESVKNATLSGFDIDGNTCRRLPIQFLKLLGISKNEHFQKKAIDRKTMEASILFERPVPQKEKFLDNALVS